MRFLASQPITGAITRLCVSARRSPVAHASYVASESCSGLTLRIAQHKSGLVRHRSLPNSASCSATVCFGVIVSRFTGSVAATASRVPMVSAKW